MLQFKSVIFLFYSVVSDFGCFPCASRFASLSVQPLPGPPKMVLSVTLTSIGILLDYLMTMMIQRARKSLGSSTSKQNHCYNFISHAALIVKFLGQNWTVMVMQLWMMLRLRMNLP